ncbi:hypothetical protein [Luteimonas saliphila]|uniref:hypothetical protein n=1 Tax=Luteimonas saliphila TaxID=2804919 RepID=UPI00192DB73B|nr:hypothetical protein [Luteimonas saliphila]
MTWIVALTALAYGLALRNGYVWDDRYFLTDYAWINTYGEALHSALQPLFNQASYFRPLSMFSLYAEAIASGRNPALSHGINLAWHAISGVLVYLLARRAALAMAPQRSATALWLPLLLTSAFIVHPALTEAVLWISARFDLMASVAMLLALWVAGLAWRDWTRALALAACFLAGALCKESVVVLPIAIGAQTLLLGAATRPDGRVVLADGFTAREWKAYAAILGAGLIYLLLRAQAMDGYVPFSVDTSLEHRIALWGTAVVKYLQLTFLPFAGNALQHSFDWQGSGTLRAHAAAIAVASAVSLAIVALALRGRRVGWVLLAWLCAYLPVIHLMPLPIGSSVIHQRFMYFPTALLLAMLPYALLRLRASVAATRAAWALGVALVLASLLVVRSVVPMWKEDLVLWSWSVEKDPSSQLARENLIYAYTLYGMTDEASRELMEIARNKGSTSARVPLNMGAAYYGKGEYETAMHYFDIAYRNIATLPQQDGAKLLASMAVTAALLGDREMASNIIMQAVLSDLHNYTALGHLEAFCGELPALGFTPTAEERRRATQVATTTVTKLRTAQPSLQAERAFCPTP